ncbi:D-glycerate dehydrogenase [Paracoccus aestuarii]|uniref:D-glycerate dehydrogenase n=1 Tax=Paracoccus aestuarii TaxID=453842 RepID=A0A418ZT72_9RHOB|nr:D-glycerate dehydrogenase [Paracoccus aestuarii]RJL01509.1 D-glycerate dehydrogenase [Paracoccus aestuarii]WCQ99913.1 D-glycerate dehydrogenase [Paracoccus aestuarii]
MRLLVTRPMTDRATRAIAAEFDATFRDNTPLTEAGAAAAMRDFDAVMPTLGDAFSAGAFAGPLRCRLLVNFGAGFNHIDIEAARAAGIAVTNTPDVVTDATADIAVTLMLMTLRRASEGERMLRGGQWTGWNPTQLLGSEMSGRTLGVVGMGRIGQAIARRCHLGFGMRVVFFNRSPVADPGVPARQIADLDAMLEAADVAVIAVPGGAATRGLIGAAQLRALGPAGVLVNIARGDVVDEDALIRALVQGGIAGAGLDVYAREPHVPQALLDAPNATLLPHLGTATDETRTRMGLRALENLRAFAAGRALPDRVA